VTRYEVVFAPQAQDHLVGLYEYVAARAAPLVAKRYTDAIVSACEALATFPHRGMPRDDVRPGLRITHHRGRAVIAYAIDDARNVVSILGIYYGGRDYEGDFDAAPGGADRGDKP
jgi:plasmid stabilization system protein ParE